MILGGIDSSLCKQIFDAAIDQYHLTNHIDSPLPDLNYKCDHELLLFNKNWIDTVQWHLEDEIRDPAIDPKEALKIKRRIDKSNQDRTDLVESLDHYFATQLVHIPKTSLSTINTETPAWAIDRLSILALKIFHMREASNRSTASERHRKECEGKLNVLLQQQEDLSIAIDQLLSDLQIGRKELKLYKQMKMYNDPALNPVLYKS